MTRQRPAAVGLDDGFDERQAEPETPLGSALVAAVEPFPDARQLVGGNARSGVGHRDEGAGAVATGRNVNLSVGGRVLHRVVDEVGEHLPQPGAIAASRVPSAPAIIVRPLSSARSA